VTDLHATAPPAAWSSSTAAQLSHGRHSIRPLAP
jgi:hypothetical protein